MLNRKVSAFSIDGMDRDAPEIELPECRNVQDMELPKRRAAGHGSVRMRRRTAGEDMTIL